MKIDKSVLTVAVFIASGAAAGLVVRSGVVHVPVLTDMARNLRVRSAADHLWPPQVGKEFPEMKLLGLSGRPIQLSDYRGRVLLIESIAMDCKACQSFSGANDPGRSPFGPKGESQPGLESLETYVRRFADTDFNDPRLLYVQVLFYDLESKRPPTVEEARKWAEHFNLNRSNVIVAIADPSYLSQETRDMIPGFHLVDQNFLLRFDAGKAPRQDLYRELLPALRGILQGEPPATEAAAAEPAAAPL